MPVVRQLPDTIESLTFEAGPPRTPGLHVSEVIQSMLRDLDGKRYGSDDTDQDKARRAIYFEEGFAFERVMEQAFAARRIDILRPGELEMDGILLSPDGVSLDDGADDEIKYTRKSMPDTPLGPKFWGWMTQFKAYCRALETDRVRVRGLFVNGDYKHGKVPDYRAWEIRFTKQEIEQNWGAILRHAEEKGMRG